MSASRADRFATGLKIGRGARLLPQRRLDRATLPRVQVDSTTAMSARLADLCGGQVLFLHHRRRSADALYGEIEHVAVTSAGVVVIAAKCYAAGEVKVRHHRRRRDELLIRGEDRSALVAALDGEVAAVRAALEGSPWHDLPVQGVLCLLDADLSQLADEVVEGHLVRGTVGTADVLLEQGRLGGAERGDLWHHLDEALPPA